MDGSANSLQLISQIKAMRIAVIARSPLLERTTVTKNNTIDLFSDVPGGKISYRTLRHGQAISLPSL